MHINLNTLKKTVISNYKNIEILNGGEISDDKLFLSVEEDSNGFSDLYYMDIDNLNLYLEKKNPGYISE